MIKIKINKLFIHNIDKVINIHGVPVFVTGVMPLNDDINAVHFFNGKVEVEYKLQEETGIQPMNKISTSLDALDAFQPCIDLWEKEIKKSADLIGLAVGDTKITVIDKTDQLADERSQLHSLYNTDWLVVRHIEQQALKTPTSLSEADFIALCKERQQARIAIKQLKSKSKPVDIVTDKNKVKQQNIDMCQQQCQQLQKDLDKLNNIKAIVKELG